MDMRDASCLSGEDEEVRESSCGEILHMQKHADSFLPFVSLFKSWNTRRDIFFEFLFIIQQTQ